MGGKGGAKTEGVQMYPPVPKSQTSKFSRFGGPLPPTKGSAARREHRLRRRYRLRRPSPHNPSPASPRGEHGRLQRARLSGHARLSVPQPSASSVLRITRGVTPLDEFRSFYAP